ncbi:Oidioi.mRNA.OKI2018_I69.chr1.g3486.t1.cds [Oikopleura dioica]|uniref:Oidioi.mRNA.OKI2018_I69.chr1.g3486.t1.cds n=1 Tax=Oikopleura dioica TaxID=34765 RepID=A0ABN7SUV5_OIKDI|nr:Oidioi.mRNA.OKI2018_I69.chr1.g3486.t1.cds [Oikopleura dioica]
MKLAATLFVVAAAGKNKDPVRRINKLRGHAETLLDLADNNTTTSDKNVARAQKWVDKVFADVAKIDTTFPCPSAEESDEVLVFDQDNFCKLNSQLGSALRSFVRTYGCDGSFPKKNFANVFAKRTNRMKNIFSRIADC